MKSDGRGAPAAPALRDGTPWDARIGEHKAVHSPLFPSTTSEASRKGIDVGVTLHAQRRVFVRAWDAFARMLLRGDRGSFRLAARGNWFELDERDAAYLADLWADVAVEQHVARVASADACAGWPSRSRAEVMSGGLLGLYNAGAARKID